MAEPDPPGETTEEGKPSTFGQLYEYITGKEGFSTEKMDEMIAQVDRLKMGLESLSIVDQKRILKNKNNGRNTLKDKFIKTKDDELPLEEDNKISKDAYNALLNLGFQSQKIREVINNISGENKNISTEDLIKNSLKKLRW